MASHSHFNVSSAAPLIPGAFSHRMFSGLYINLNFNVTFYIHSSLSLFHSHACFSLIPHIHLLLTSPFSLSILPLSLLTSFPYCSIWVFFPFVLPSTLFLILYISLKLLPKLIHFPFTFLSHTFLSSFTLLYMLRNIPLSGHTRNTLNILISYSLTYITQVLGRS